MAFHVEISDGSNHARVFNLSPAELREQVIVRFLAGVDIELGDRTWAPARCELVILEGPALEAVDLAFGQGWSNAHRKARDVTHTALETVRESLASAGVAVLASEPQDESYVRAALERVGLQALAWAPLRDRLVAGHRDDVVVVIAIGDAAPDIDWWFAAGLAIGALSERTVVVATGTGPLPGLLADRRAHRLDDGDEPFAAALQAAGAAGAYASAQRARSGR